FPLLKAALLHCTIFTGGGEPAARVPYDDFPQSTVTACMSGSMSLATSVSNCPVAAVSGQKNWLTRRTRTPASNHNHLPISLRTRSELLGARSPLLQFGECRAIFAQMAVFLLA